MKKTLAIALVGIAALALLICGAKVIIGKDDPTIDTSEQSEKASYKSTSETNGYFVDESLTSTSEAGEETSAGSTVSEIAETVTAQFSGSTTKGNRTSATAAPVTANQSSGYKYAYAGFNPSYAKTGGVAWNRILVNRDYILPDNFTVKLAPAIKSEPDGEQLDYRVAEYYNKMYLAAEKDGVELTPISGYRSVQRQTRNFENKIDTYMDQGYSKIEATQLAAKIILPPGTSEHNAGLAMDICSLYESFDKTDEYKWLSENAADYGFILRYPKDKENKTKIVYEPWHWRFVGVETAKAVKASGLCYEEYLGLA